MSNAYSRPLRKLVFEASVKLQLPSDSLAEGTYAWVSGPTYETPAEGRFLRNAGADVVGMSTIPEVIVAREEGLEVIVLSLVTNFVVIPDGYRSVREEVEAEVRFLDHLERGLIHLISCGQTSPCSCAGSGDPRRGASSWHSKGRSHAPTH
jgi:purine nucleoside phosphorylase